MKTCGMCHKTKEESQFHKNRQMLDGLHTYCKLCRKGMYSAYRQKNRKSILEKETYAHRRDRIKRSARKEVSNAISRGDMPLASECSCAICKNGAQDYHHESYEIENWLKVVPLCRSCHRDLHCGNISL